MNRSDALCYAICVIPLYFININGPAAVLEIHKQPLLVLIFVHFPRYAALTISVPWPAPRHFPWYAYKIFVLQTYTSRITDSNP